MLKALICPPSRDATKLPSSASGFKPSMLQSFKPFKGFKESCSLHMSDISSTPMAKEGPQTEDGHERGGAAAVILVIEDSTRSGSGDANMSVFSCEEPPQESLFWHRVSPPGLTNKQITNNANESLILHRLVGPLRNLPDSGLTNQTKKQKQNQPTKQTKKQTQNKTSQQTNKQSNKQSINKTN